MDTYTKRLSAITKATHGARLTTTELEWATIAAKHAHKEGARGTPPPHLDITSISALRDSEGLVDSRACLNPKYIRLICTHLNTTARVARCRWCDGCVNAWKSRVRAIVSQGSTYAETFFWTLTLKEYPYEMDEERFDFIQTRWRRLLRVLYKQKFGMAYLRVIELQKRGTPHYHLAVNRLTQLEELGVDKLKRVLYDASVEAGFGREWDFERARYGAAGVASYMAKYLQKGNDYRELRREDGRAVRRFSRSVGWVDPAPENTWRYAAVPGSFTAASLSEAEVDCECGLHETQTREEQTEAWLATNRRVGRWVAPLGVLDHIMEEESDKTSPLPRS